MLAYNQSSNNTYNVGKLQNEANIQTTQSSHVFQEPTPVTSRKRKEQYHNLKPTTLFNILDDP